MIDFAGFDNGEKPINQDLKMKYVTTAVRRQGSDRPSLLATFTIAPTGALIVMMLYLIYTHINI